MVWISKDFAIELWFCAERLQFFFQGHTEEQSMATTTKVWLVRSLVFQYSTFPSSGTDPTTPQNLHRNLHLGSLSLSKNLCSFYWARDRTCLRTPSTWRLGHQPGEMMVASQVPLHPEQTRCLELHHSISSLSAPNTVIPAKVSLPRVMTALEALNCVGKISEVSKKFRGHKSSRCLRVPYQKDAV